MILELKVKNFRSIRDWQSLNMLAERKVNEHEEQTVEVENNKVLKSAVIYGRNASGKSNILKAFRAIQYMVLNSKDFKLDKKIPPYEPFKLDNKSSNEPTEILIDFIANNNIRYVYEIGYSASRIEYEILKFYPKSQPAILFERHINSPIKYGDYMIGRKKEIEETLYENQLFLSKVGTQRLDSIIAPYLFFSNGLFVSTFHDSQFDNGIIQVLTNKLVNNDVPFFKENINKLMQAADTGIDGISIREDNSIKRESLPEDMSDEDKNKIIENYKYKIRTLHKKFDDNNQEAGTVEFKLNEESTGTIKLLSVGGLILDALSNGQVLIVDELDKSLHPKLTRSIVKIFNNKKTNPKNAQLIFATHDVSLLDNELFRRDQIWFAEKEYEGFSYYYSISDLKGVRKDVPFEKYYISGKFGATPVINDLDLFFKF